MVRHLLLLCVGENRRWLLREFAPHSRESLISPLRGANRLCAGADDWHKLDAFLCEESHMPRFSKSIHAF